MIFPEPLFSPLGDAAVTITLGDEISPAMSARVISLSRAIEVQISDAIDIVPSYAAISVFYDSARASYDEVIARLHEVSRQPVQPELSSSPAAPVVRIPVKYDGEDLNDVARRTELTPDAVIDLHTSREYRVYMLGFAPGFGYMGEIDPRLKLPRRDSPRKRVPPGSVAIAETQTGVYPSATAGGWHLIGRTDLAMFDVGRDPPALLTAGTRVVFERLPE